MSPAWSEASRSRHTRWCINKAVHIQGAAHTRRCTQKAVCGHSKVLFSWGGAGVSPASSAASGSPHTRRCTYKAVHTQGVAHKRRSVATAGVLLFRGGAGVSPASSVARRSPHTRRCINKAVHIQGGAHTRRCTQKAVCGHSRVLFYWGGAGVSPASSAASRSPHTRWCINKAVHIQGCAHTRRCTQKAVCGHHRSLVI